MLKIRRPDSMIPCFQTGFRLAMIVCLFLLNGCYSLTFQSVHPSPIYLNQPQILKSLGPVQVLRHLYYETSVDYIFGTHPGEMSLLSEVLQKELKADEGLVNFRIEQTPTPLDMTVSVLSLGIYSRSKLIIEGDVIRVLPKSN